MSKQNEDADGIDNNTNNNEESNDDDNHEEATQILTNLLFIYVNISIKSL